MNEVESVATALRDFLAQVDALNAKVMDRRTFTRDELEELRAEMRTLKDAFKRDGKPGTVGGAARPQTKIESLFYSRRMFQIYAQFDCRANSHPVSGSWADHLFTAQSDLSYMLLQLEDAYPQIRPQKNLP